MLALLMLTSRTFGVIDRANDLMLTLHEETLDEALGFEPNTFRRLVEKASRGDTDGPLLILAAACKEHKADLNSWAALHELYGVFQRGKAVPADPNIGIDATLL